MKSNRDEILLEINSTIRSLRRELGLLEDKLALLQDELAGGAENAEAMTLDIDDEMIDGAGGEVSEIAGPVVQETMMTAVGETGPAEKGLAPAVEDMVQLDSAETQVMENETADPFMELWEDDSIAFCGMDDIGDLPEDSASEEGAVMEMVTEEQPKGMTVNDVAEPASAVIDEMMTRQAWRTDMAGSHVNDVRSAISLNDRILFINTLCHEDAVEFTSLVSEVNAKTSFDEAVDYILSTHPQWNFESEVVYRFMMAVRRRFV